MIIEGAEYNALIHERDETRAQLASATTWIAILEGRLLRVRVIAKAIKENGHSAKRDDRNDRLIWCDDLIDLADEIKTESVRIDEGQSQDYTSA